MKPRVRKQLAGFATIVLAAFLTNAVAGLAMADPADISGQAGSDAYEIVGEQANEALGSVQDPSSVQPASGNASQLYEEYRWVSVCSTPTEPSGLETFTDCPAARSCADPAQRLWRLWGRELASQPWVPLGTQCFGGPPPAVGVPRPQITAAMVLNAMRRIGLPSLQAHTQPAGKTLVNFETILYAEPQTFTPTVQLLGQRVDIEATPSQFTWHHGDGTSATTTSPGAPYPSKEITYKYTDAHTTVTPSVDVTYTARFRVNGGGWQDIGETVTIAGPASSLRISEATAVLSGDYE
jgi:hypothetical protein